MTYVDTKEILRVFTIELNKAMEEKGVTYRQLALAVKVNHSNMYQYKIGKAFPDLYTLSSMANYLCRSVDSLLGYIEEHDAIDEEDLVTNRFTNEDEFADYFRTRLQEYMKMKNMDVEELARRSEVSANTIDMYLSVHRWVPRTPELLRLCSALNCTPSELLGY